MSGHKNAHAITADDKAVGDDAENALAEVAEKHGIDAQPFDQSPRRHRHYRRMLEEMHPTLDDFTIKLPDFNLASIRHRPYVEVKGLEWVWWDGELVCCLPVDQVEGLSNFQLVTGTAVQVAIYQRHWTKPEIRPNTLRVISIDEINDLIHIKGQSAIHPEFDSVILPINSLHLGFKKLKQMKEGAK